MLHIRVGPRCDALVLLSLLSAKTVAVGHRTLLFRHIAQYRHF